ncbi:MAG: DUF4286 family protein [Phycisphaerales bacterium]
MTPVAYTVTARFADPSITGEYIRWLSGGHIRAVIAGGAQHAEIVRIDDPSAPARVEVRYTFPDRATLDRYLAQFAPALRADGLARFPPDRGITFERTTGPIGRARGDERLLTGSTLTESEYTPAAP